MLNELIFIAHSSIIGLMLLFSLKLGKEALIALICLFCVLANFFIAKQIPLFGLQATATDAFTIGIVLGFNLLQEYFGKEIAQKTITISFIVSICALVLSQIHLAYVPNGFDSAHVHYYALFALTPRIITASLFTYFIVQQLEYRLYGFLKKQCHNKYLVMRNVISISICQLLDTILFSFLGLYGIISHLGELIIISYTIKLIAISLSTPFIWYSKKSYNQNSVQILTNGAPDS